MVRFKGTPPYVEFVEHGEPPYPDQPKPDPDWSWHDWLIDQQQEQFWLTIAAIDATKERLEHERATRPVCPEDV